MFMKINTKKTKWMILYPYQSKRIDEHMLYPLLYNDNLLDKCTSFNYLGLSIDYKKHFLNLDV